MQEIKSNIDPKIPVIDDQMEVKDKEMSDEVAGVVAETEQEIDEDTAPEEPISTEEAENNND